MNSRKKWGVDLIPPKNTADFPVNIDVFASDIVRNLPEAFWIEVGEQNAPLLNDEVFCEVPKELDRIAGSVAMEVIQRVIVRPHWFAMSVVGNDVHSDRWNQSPPTLWERAHNQMQHGLDNLADALRRAIRCEMPTAAAARKLLHVDLAA